MKISSPAFEHNGIIPVRYTCKGKNVNPPLMFEDVPLEAKSLVLTIEDVNSGPPVWIHWFVYNILPSTVSVAEGVVPGTEGLCNNSTFGYEGPCPIYFTGVHHYQFHLFALGERIETAKAIAKADIAEVLAEDLLSRVTMTGIITGTGEQA